MENPNDSSPITALCAGEALIDLVADSSGKLTPCLGGAVYNLTRALALQGVSTGYLNPLSADLYGQQLRAGLRQSGVQVLHARAVPEPTSLAVVNIDGAGKAAYTFYRAQVADRATSADELNHISMAGAASSATLVCTGCLALAPEDAATYLPWLAEQKKRGRVVAIDINVRAAVMKDAASYRAHILQALQYADIVKASDEDLDFLAMSAKSVLERSSAHLFLLTLGSQGARVLTRSGIELAAQVPQGLQAMPLVDTVGAGDCFLGGFLAYWLKTKPADHAVQAALHHAVCAASINCTRLGCQPPTWDETIAHAQAQKDAQKAQQA